MTETDNSRGGQEEGGEGGEQRALCLTKDSPRLLSVLGGEEERRGGDGGERRRRWKKTGEVK